MTPPAQQTWGGFTAADFCPREEGIGSSCCETCSVGDRNMLSTEKSRDSAWKIIPSGFRSGWVEEIDQIFWGSTPIHKELWKDLHFLPGQQWPHPCYLREFSFRWLLLWTSWHSRWWSPGWSKARTWSECWLTVLPWGSICSTRNKQQYRSSRPTEKLRQKTTSQKLTQTLHLNVSIARVRQRSWETSCKTPEFLKSSPPSWVAFKWKQTVLFIETR